jgi:hypothetical protein
LNDGQLPNPNAVRVVPGSVLEGNRRASRNGRVSDLPPETPNVTIRDFFITCSTSASLRPICSSSSSSLAASSVPSCVIKPPSTGSIRLYVSHSVFRAPSAMSSVGSGGRKSLPTSMHSSTKSSMSRSRQ